MEDVAVSAARGPVVEPPPVASFLILLSGKRMAKKRRQCPQAVSTGLKEDYPPKNKKIKINNKNKINK